MGANTRRLTGHLAANVFTRSLLACVLCLVVYAAIDLVEASSLAGVKEVLITTYLFKLPSVLTHILPLAVLVGALVTLSAMRSGGQWDAMGAAGISPTVPIGGLLVVPWSAAALSSLLAVWIAPMGLSVWHARLESDAAGSQNTVNTGTRWIARDGLLIRLGGQGELHIERNVQGLPRTRVEMGNDTPDGKASVWRAGRGWRKEVVPSRERSTGDATLLAELYSPSLMGIPGDSLTVPALLEAIPLATRRGLNPAPLKAELALRIALIAACVVLPLFCLGVGAGLEIVSATGLIGIGIAVAAVYWLCLAVVWNSAVAGVLAAYWLYAVVPLFFAGLGILAVFLGAARSR